MIFKIRPGVILVKICDEYLLVSAKEARNYCPYIQQINETGAFIWNQISDNKTIDSIQCDIRNKYNLPEDVDLKETVLEFLNELVEKNYLIRG